MKIRVLGVALVLVSTVIAQTTTVPPPAKKAAPAPAKKADAKAQKVEETPKISGVEIARGDRGYLGLEVVGGNFKLSFYDQKKKPVAPDVARAVLRWDPKYKVGEERVVLNPGGDPNSLTAPKGIRPPYNFKVYVLLLNAPAEGDGQPGESYVVDFRQ